MSLLMIILRIIHIFCGVFWVGFAVFNFVFLQPAIKATGAEGQTFIQYLSQKTRLMPTVYIAATLTFISGLAMFWPMAVSMPSTLHSGYGMMISVGALAGIIAWILAIFVIRRIMGQIQTQGQVIQAQEGPPSQDQLELMAALSARMSLFGKLVLGFLFLALLGMSVAQYSPF